MAYKPPYSLNGQIVGLLASIAEKIGFCDGLHLSRPNPQLRKSNKVKSIHSSLYIEGNSLSLDQVTAIIEGKKVLGPRKDILEVKNAIKTYGLIEKFKFDSVSSLLTAHKTMMTGLLETAGQLRSGNVGILKGSKVAHIAPPAKLVKQHIHNLFEYLKSSEHPLIKSCVFHYEFEFIHPFADGNGRIGRLWQTVILASYNDVFEYLPIESLVKLNQKQYYKALEESDRSGNSTVFVEFMLSLIDQALEQMLNELKPQAVTFETRIEIARNNFGKQKFGRKDYIKLFKNISTATASRDLKQALTHKMLTKQGAANQTVYRFRAPSSTYIKATV